MSAQISTIVSALDPLYYGVYRFTRKVGHAHLTARTLAALVLPLFFVVAGISLCAVWTLVADLDLPSKAAKPYVVGLLVVLGAASYIFYERRGRGDRIIFEYEKSKNQKRYLWLGGVFAIGTLFSPMWLFLLLRAGAALKQ